MSMINQIKAIAPFQNERGEKKAESKSKQDISFAQADRSSAGKKEKAKEDSKQSERQMAEVVQKELSNRMNSLRFVIREPGSTRSNNIIIEVVNHQNEVVATIPNKAIQAIADAVAQGQMNEGNSTGLLLNERIA